MAGGEEELALRSAVMAELHQLESLLVTLGTARDSLPALLRALEAGTASEAAALYRARAQHAVVALGTLKTQLQSVQPLQARCDESDRLDPVVLPERPAPVALSGLERLGSILGGQSGLASANDDSRSILLVRNRLELVRVLEDWADTHEKVLFEEIKVGEEPREVVMRLKGLMKVSLDLHWRTRHDAREVQVERVSCYSLKETVSPSFRRARSRSRRN